MSSLHSTPASEERRGRPAYKYLALPMLHAPSKQWNEPERQRRSSTCGSAIVGAFGYGLRRRLTSRNSERCPPGIRDAIPPIATCKTLKKTKVWVLWPKEAEKPP
jgi:hypothetical protein